MQIICPADTIAAMHREDFNFDLPESLIAQYPTAERTDSRLLCLDRQTGRLDDSLFRHLPQRLKPGDLLVFNNTRVIPARLFAKKQTGGSCEVLIERLLNGQEALAHVRASKSPRAGTRLLLDDGTEVSVMGRQQDLFQLRFETDSPLLDLLERIGHVPLPPYIERGDEAGDRERYQTVYSSVPGAVAAPTAGLHFDRPLLDSLSQQGVEQVYVTLHVGAGTFQPVRVDNIAEHRMHSEWFEISTQVCDRVRSTRAAGGRVIAVGTTAVRALESASRHGEITACSGETDIFIYPGYRFNTVDAMITNFHLPESTLLMLVCAFAGYNNTMQAYRHAVEQHYRFFSYGDAMFINGAAT